MVLLDTNVVSESMRTTPSAEVMLWTDALPSHEMFVTAITEAEVRSRSHGDIGGIRLGQLPKQPCSELQFCCTRTIFCHEALVWGAMWKGGLR